MERLNIYFVHSDKFDYNNLIYKKILSSSVCLSQNFILPYTKENVSKYSKDLIDKADLIIADVYAPSFGLSLELKWLSKRTDKKILYISANNEIPKKFQKLVPSIVKHDSNNTYIKVIEEFIQKELEERSKFKDDIYTLGEL